MKSLIARLRREKPWRIFPRGWWTEADGSYVIFDYKYRPICRVRPDGDIEILPPTQRISFARQSYLFTEAVHPESDLVTRRRVLGVVKRLNLLEELKRRRTLENEGMLPPCAELTGSVP